MLFCNILFYPKSAQTRVWNETGWIYWHCFFVQAFGRCHLSFRHGIALFRRMRLSLFSLILFFTMTNHQKSVTTNTIFSGNNARQMKGGFTEFNVLFCSSNQSEIIGFDTSIRTLISLTLLTKKFIIFWIIHNYGSLVYPFQKVNTEHFFTLSLVEGTVMLLSNLKLHIPNRLTMPISGTLITWHLDTCYPSSACLQIRRYNFLFIGGTNDQKYIRQALYFGHYNSQNFPHFVQYKNLLFHYIKTV